MTTVIPVTPNFEESRSSDSSSEIGAFVSSKAAAASGLRQDERPDHPRGKTGDPLRDAVPCIGRNADELLRLLQAAQFVAQYGDQVCPAKWQPGAKTLKPGLDLVGQL